MLKKVDYFFSGLFLGKLTSIMIVLLCFSYPISVIFALSFGIPTGIFNVFYRALIALFAFYISSISIFRNGFIIAKSSVIMILFLMAYLLRIIFDTFIIQIETVHTNIEIYSFFLGNICLPFLAIVLAFKYVNKESLFKGSFIILLISNILLICRYFYQLNWEFSPKIFLLRATINGDGDLLDIVNSITFGLNGGLLFIFSLCRFMLIRIRFKPFERALFLTSTMLGLINLLLASSRGPMLFTFLSLISVVYFYNIYSKKTLKFYLRYLFYFSILIVCFISVVSYLKVNDIELSVFSRLLETKENIQGGQREERNDIYSEALNMFFNSPIIGSQLNTFSLTYPHNLILELLMSTGIIGTILYLIGISFIFIKTLSFRKHGVFFAVFVCIFLLFFGLAQTSGNLYQSVENWCFIAVLLSWSNTVPET